MKYIARGINLDEEVWAALEKARQIHGSYNKFLRHVFTAAGAFEQREAAIQKIFQSKLPSQLRAPLLKPKQQPTAPKARRGK